MQVVNKEMTDEAELDNIKAALESGEKIRADLNNQISVLVDALTALDRTQRLLKAELGLKK